MKPRNWNFTADADTHRAMLEGTLPPIRAKDSERTLTSEYVAVRDDGFTYAWLVERPNARGLPMYWTGYGWGDDTEGAQWFVRRRDANVVSIGQATGAGSESKLHAFDLSRPRGDREAFAAAALRQFRCDESGAAALMQRLFDAYRGRGRLPVNTRALEADVKDWLARASSGPEGRAEGQSPAERPLTVTDEAKAGSEPAVDLLRATVNRLMGERDALAGALRYFVERADPRHDEIYFAHGGQDTLERARAALAQLDSVAPPLTPND